MKRRPRILLACEESDEVRRRFELKGFDAWSCDIQPNRSPNPKHFQCDVTLILDQDWDAMIAFPPCTDLACSGAAWFERKIKDGSQSKAVDFFLTLANAPIKRKALENPVGIMSSIYKKPTQIIQPFMFGDRARKKTCLWLENLPPLIHNKQPNLFDEPVTWVDEGESVVFESGKKMSKWYADAWNLPKKERAKVRSKTFPGIAQAMADQWSKIIAEC